MQIQAFPWSPCLLVSLSLSVFLLFIQLAGAQTATDRDLVRIRAEEERRPWLTLNAGGHTATVNALAFTPDSKHLYSAGLDKAVNVWDMSAAVRDLRRGKLLERSLRWPVNRGLRGGIYTLAVAPSDGLLAVAGYGASSWSGEIWLIDPRQGTLVKQLRRDDEKKTEGHEQAVISLAFSADGNWLASLDLDGKTILWRRGDWEPSRIYGVDKQVYRADVYGPNVAALIAAEPQLRPLTILGSSHLLVPVFTKRGPEGRPRWRLHRLSLTNLKDTKTFDQLHFGVVTALAASANGQRWASADLSGNLFVWDAARAAPRRFPVSHNVLSLAFTPDGARLLVGTANKDSKSEVQLWDVATGQLVTHRELTDHVRTCAISPDGSQLAYTGGSNHAVMVASLASFPSDTSLRSSVEPVFKVAFTNEKEGYRLAFGNRLRPQAFNDKGPLERSFDPQELSLTGSLPIEAGDWLSPHSAAGTWRAELGEQSGRTVLQLFEGKAKRGYIQKQPDEGDIRCYCFLPGANGRPAAVAVGTNIQNTIFVCGITAQGPCPMLRCFRGHSDYVTSLCASLDGRYLVSGSADGTVRIWSLSDYAKGRESIGRWGAQFAVEGARLVVKSINQAGPLFFKGVRAGDELKEIVAYDGKRDVLHQRAEAIAKQLAEAPFPWAVEFHFRRDDQDRSPFQLMPAWQPLANLFANDEGEWAFWTPEGYYDASPNGHTLFGWQVNRGVTATPEFYRADQFRKNLERPDVLERLLPTGSLDSALRQAMLAPPAEPEQVVAQQILATPRITVVSPQQGESIDNESTLLRAIVDVPQNGEVVQAKAFANGVVARERRLVEEREIDGHQQLIYEWQLGLPAERRVLVQVVAGSAAKTAALSSVLIERNPAKAPAERLPRLYLLAVGVDRYRDAAIQPLAFAVADARSVVDLFIGKTPGLYQLVDPVVRVNEQVTRADWKAAFSEISDRLKADVRPDDLLIIFMAGHGFVDPEEQRYYFASQDISADDVLEGRYQHAISWDDFDLLADVPCRKLAFLDTCHSGAIQPLRDRDLKAAIRALQDDVVLTVAASAGHERSEEKPAWGHGAFTKTLLEGLGGLADTSRDGSVSLDELIFYVKTQVPKLTAGRQNPAAAPDDLLRYVSLRLTEAKDLEKTTSAVRPKHPSTE